MRQFVTAIDRKLVDTRMTVETPEGVDFQYVVVGSGISGPAYSIDFLLRAGMVGFVTVKSVSRTDKTVSDRSSQE